MTLVTLRPTATTEVDNVSIVGAATVHAAWADDADTSYVTSIGSDDGAEVSFAAIGAPAGAVVKSVTVRARHARTTDGTRKLYYELAILRGTVEQDFNAAPTINYSTPTTVTIAGGPLTNTLASDITLIKCEAEKGSSSTIRVYALYLDVVYVSAPTVTVSAYVPSTITTTNVPAVSWGSTLDPDGDSQSHFDAKIFTAAQYGAGGFDPATSPAFEQSGEVTSGEVVWQPTLPLSNGTYRAYVRIAQTVGGVALWSAWAFTEFTISLNPPAVPLITATAESSLARIRVNVTGQTGAETTTSLELERSVDGGVTWTAFRLPGTNGVAAGTSIVAYDYEAPPGTTVLYRARSQHDFGFNLFAASAWTSSASASWVAAAKVWWLKCPERPALNTNVTIYSLASVQRPARMTAFQPLGRSDAIVVSDRRGSARGTLQLWIEDAAEKATIDLLLDAGATLLLQGPPEDNEPIRYIRLGDHERERIVDKSWIATSIDTFAWFEVAAPVGPVDAWPP